MDQSTDKLTKLAREANEAHAKCQDHFKRGVDYAIAAGKALAKAKTRVPHGQWSSWLAENFDGSERLAQLYARLARRMFELDDETRNAVAEMSIREADRAIAEPRRLVIRQEEPVPVVVQTVHVRACEPEPVATPRLLVHAAPEGPSARPEHHAAPERVTGVEMTKCQARPNPKPSADAIDPEGHSRALPELMMELCRSHAPGSVAQQLASCGRLTDADLDRLKDWLIDVGEALNRRSDGHRHLG